jgi:hypothetical protein
MQYLYVNTYLLYIYINRAKTNLNTIKKKNTVYSRIQHCFLRERERENKKKKTTKKMSWRWISRLAHEPTHRQSLMTRPIPPLQPDGNHPQSHGHGAI